MKVLNILSKIIVSVLVVMVTMAVSDTKTNENKNIINSEVESEAVTFTLNGTVTSDHDDLSWNTCTGANLYELSRTPTPSLGGASKSVIFDQFDSADSFLDEAVHGAALGTGFDQVRYVVKAYHAGVDNGTSFKNLYCTSNPVDYTADSID